MTEFITEVAKVFTKLLKLQQADPPVFLLEGITNVLRFALLGAVLLAVVLLVQMLICIRQKKRKNALYMGITIVALLCVSVWGLGVPAPVAAQEKVMSISVQSLTQDANGNDVYGNSEVLSEVQVQKIVAAVEKASSGRTLRRNLPTPAKQDINLVLTLEGDKAYQILLTPKKGYRYLTATTDFIYEIKDYDRFYKTITAIVG